MTDVEELGWEIFEDAGYTPDAPPTGGAIALAIELYGGDCLRESPRAQFEATPGRMGDRRFISVAPRLTPRRRHFAIAHALARIELGKRGVTDLRPEDLAAFIVAPPDAFRERVLAGGVDLPRLADSFVVTQTCAAIRLVEVGETDGAVVTPDRVYRPGSLLSWCDDDAVRRLAKGTPRALRKVAIRDEPGRVALYRAS